MPYNLILWRHADAEYLEENPQSEKYQTLDLARPLSHKGQAQAKKMAHWLKKHLPHNTIIVSSPALRAEQTLLPLKFEYLIADALQPEATLNDVLALISQLDAENLLLVGHQPWLGAVIGHLLDMNQEASTSIKKGAVWWFKNANFNALNSLGKHAYKLHTVQHPNLL